MTGNDYQYLAMRTASANTEKDMIYHGVFDLTSEAGEVAGLLHKFIELGGVDDESKTG